MNIDNDFWEACDEKNIEKIKLLLIGSKQYSEIKELLVAIISEMLSSEYNIEIPQLILQYYNDINIYTDDIISCIEKKNNFDCVLKLYNNLCDLDVKKINKDLDNRWRLIKILYENKQYKLLEIILKKDPEFDYDDIIFPVNENNYIFKNYIESYIYDF
jgi:hypothetical protein